MNSRSAWFLCLATSAALVAIGVAPSLSQPRVGPDPRPVAAPVAHPVAAPAPAPASAPAPLVPPAVAPAPTVASGAPVSQDPRPNAPRPNAPRPNAPQPDAPRPHAAPAAVGETYALPVGLAPVTNRNTCRHAPRDCCSETRDWCLAEGFVWRDCKNCYCGSQCLAPGLFKD